MIRTFDRPRLRARAAGAYAAAFASLIAAAAGPATAGVTTTVVEASKAKSVFSEKVTLTATVSGAAPTGTVTFKADGKSIGTAKLTGDAALAYTAVIGGFNFSCGLIEDGSVRCWGFNGAGQLGDGSTTDSATPVSVTGLAGTAVAISGMAEHACALIEDGSVQCWGDNGSGRLGDGTATDSATPVSVTGLAGPVIAVSAGNTHSCAVIDDGSVQCWGSNTNGRLGDGTTTNSATPVSVTGLAGPVISVAAGAGHTCVVIEGGDVQCWGNGSFGRFGNGTSTSSKTPVSVPSLAGLGAAVVAGDAQTCFLLNDGTVRCTGSNSAGSLGNGTTSSSNTPVAVQNLAGVVTAIPEFRGNHHCALIQGGSVQCWGSNFSGQLGDGSTTNRSAAVAVTDLAGSVVAVATGFSHSCAVIDDGSVQCWGFNGAGQVGDGTTESSSVPVDVFVPTVERAVSVTVDDFVTGKHALTALYAGDDANDASTSDELKHTVAKADTTIKQLKIKPKTPQAGKTAKATVKVQQIKPATAKPDGRMKIVLDGKKVANVTVNNGKAAFKLPKLGKGKSKLKVAYTGTGNFAKSADKTTFNVKKKK